MLRGVSEPTSHPTRNSSRNPHNKFIPSHSTGGASASCSDALNGQASNEQPLETRATRRTTNAIPIVEPRSLAFAPSGRPYRLWQDGEHSESTLGSLIPDGYQKSSSGQFPCPVVTCHFYTGSLRNLGNHFSRAHRAACLNDNLDGTFTKVGDYEGNERTHTLNGQRVAKPALVISQKALVASEECHSSGMPSSNTRTEAQGRDRASTGHDTPSRDGGISRTATSSHMLLDNRPYLTWTDSTGIRHDTKGVLIPKEYKLDDTVPDRSWICPLRTCRWTYRFLWELARHFKAAHGQCRFNDNGDGTLSIARTPVRIGEQLPAVVSVIPLDSTEAPMNYPQVPFYPTNNKKSGHAVWGMYRGPTATERDTPTSRTPVESGQTSRVSGLDTSAPVTGAGIKAEDVPNEVFECISPFVSKSIFNDEATPEEKSIKGILGILLGLPLLRQLNWNPDFKGPRLLRERREVIAIIVQVVGEESERECTGCRLNSVPSPWLGCIFLPLEATREAIPYKWSCANCQFLGRNVLTCSTARLSKQRLDRQGPGPPPTSAPVQAAVPAPAPVTTFARGNCSEQPSTRTERPLDDDDDVVLVRVRHLGPSQFQDGSAVARTTAQDKSPDKTDNMEETRVTQRTGTSSRPTPQAMRLPTLVHDGEEYVPLRDIEGYISREVNLQLAKQKADRPPNKKRRRKNSEAQANDESEENSSMCASEEGSSTTSKGDSSPSEGESSSEEESDDMKSFLEWKKFKRMSRREKKRATGGVKEKSRRKPTTKKARKADENSSKTKKNEKH